MTTAHTMSAVGWLNGQNEIKRCVLVRLAEPHALENVQLRARIEEEHRRVASSFRTEIKITKVRDGKMNETWRVGRLDSLGRNGGFMRAATLDIGRSGKPAARLLRSRVMAAICLRWSRLSPVVLENSAAPPWRKRQERCAAQHDDFEEKCVHQPYSTYQRQEVFDPTGIFPVAFGGQDVNNPKRAVDHRAGSRMKRQMAFYRVPSWGGPESEGVWRRHLSPHCSHQPKRREDHQSARQARRRPSCPRCKGPDTA